jgi:aldehyde:ferredoxin oxidoreductase
MVWFGVDNAGLLRWLNHITGWDMPMEEFILAGERIFNLKRLFNVREGISRKDDNLPPRIQYSPRGEGGGGDHIPPLPDMLNQYYVARGWNEFGIPTDETKSRLSLV